MDEQIIVIRKAIVRRIDHQPGTKKYKYAFEFSAIGADQTRKLTRAIYHLQRQFLLRR